MKQRKKRLFLQIFLFLTLFSIIVIADGSTIPTIDSIVLNSTYATNSTNENLTTTVTSSDGGSDPVKTMYSHKIDGKHYEILVAPFEGGSNTTFTEDNSNFDRNGTVNGATWNSTGGHDGKGAYEFDGINDRIQFGDGTEGDIQATSKNGFTASAWFKTKDISQTAQIIMSTYNWGASASAEYGMRVYYSAENKIYFRIDTGYSGGARELTIKTDNVTHPIVNNQWYHVVVAFNGTENHDGMQLFINGVDAKGGNTSTGAIQDFTVNFDAYLTIGIQEDNSHNQYNTNPFNGTIDDIRWYNRTLSIDQMRNIYLNQSHVISFNETTTGENWTSFATPNDGFVDGTTVESPGLVILANGAAQVQNLVVNASSTTNRTNENIQVNFSILDPDGDATATVIDWYVNNVYNSTFVNETTIGSGNTSKDDNWTAVVAVWDGTVWGTNKTGTVIVANTLPSVVNFAYNSTDANNYTNGTLQVSYQGNDDDSSDPSALVTTWLVDGVLNTTFTNITSIGSGNTTKGENWTVIASVWDGTNWSTNSTAGITIKNTAPILTRFAYNSTNSNNDTTGDLQVSIQGNDSDNDTLYIAYDWYKDNVLQTALQNATTIASTNLVADQNWTVIVSSGDGSNRSLNKTGTVIIQAAPSSSSTSSSSSGGSSEGKSSSSSAAAAPEEEDTELDIERELIVEGAKAGDIFNFTFENESHSLTIEDVTNDSVNLTFRSTPINFNIPLFKMEYIDLDQDGSSDFGIELAKIYEDKTFDLFIMNLKEAEDLTIEGLGTEIEETNTHFALIVLIVLISLITMLTVIHYITRR